MEKLFCESDNLRIINDNIECVDCQNDIMDFFIKKKIDAGWSFSEYKPSETSKWTNGYHRYPAKFIPQLVEKLFDEYLDTDCAVINDPFMGSGTTAVSSVVRGHRFFGTDINPISYLITKVKSFPLEPFYLQENANKFFNNIRKNIVNTPPQVDSIHYNRIKYWFDDQNIEKLYHILKIINLEDDNRFRDFYYVAFSNILKNCSIWLQSSTKPTRDLKKRPENPFIALQRQINKMIKGNDNFYNIVPKKVKNNIEEYINIRLADAKIQPVESNMVDLIVTSSPYVTSYEYADLHQLSTIWLNLAEDINEHKKKFIGTSLKKYDNIELLSKIALSTVNKMSNVDKKMAKEIEAFFIDMQDVISESKRILKIGGRACYVIGNTTLKGIKICNAEIFAEIMQKIGLKLDRVIKREIPLKILPQKRDLKTGRFAKSNDFDSEAYPIEYIVIGKKVG